MRPTVKLGEICEIERGGSPRPIQEFLTTEENGVNWIKIGDTKTQPKYIEYTAEKIKPEGVKRSRMVYPGDFILSNSMSFGRPYIMKTSGCIHDGRLVLRPDNRIDKEFLYYLLGSEFMYKKFENSASGTGVKNLNIDKVKVVEIPLPPLETQKAIVAKLDQIFAELDQTKSEIQKNLDNTDELWKSALNQSFQGDWEMKKLGEIGSLTRGKGFLKSDFVENGFPCIHYGQIHMKFDTAIDKNITYIPEELAKKSGIAEKNDVIIVITSEDVEGSCKSIAWLGNYPVAVGAHAAIYKHTQNPLFVSYYFQTSMFFKQKINYTHGSKVVEIKPVDVGNCTIPVPPLSEQEKIVEHLDQVSKEVKALKSQYQSQLDNLEELKKSVLDKAFKGELGE